MEKMYTATVTTVGGRNGHIKSSDGALDIQVRMPREMGGPAGSYTNPEQLFAAGYAACLNQALIAAGQKEGLNLTRSEVKVSVSIGKDSDGETFRLSVDIEILLPAGIAPEQAAQVSRQAHDMCPYSKATKGNIESRMSYKIME